MAEFQKIKQVKARKRHKCQLCSADILPGCEYILEKYKDGGRIRTLYRHIHCDAVLQEYLDGYCLDSFYENGDVYDTVREICREYCTQEQADECFGILSRPYSCGMCLQKFLPASVLGAALQSIRDNRE